MSRKFEHVSGSTQSWLIVTASDLAKVRLNRSHFSNASLISKAGEIALDDAWDALLFLKKWSGNVGPYTLLGAHHKAADVAAWSPFGTKGIDPEPFKCAADFNQSQSAAEVAEEERQAAAEAMQMQDRAYHSQDVSDEEATAHQVHSLT